MPQTGYDLRAFGRYQRALALGRNVPAIVVVQVSDKRILCDGRHRLKACLALGRRKIAAHIFKGTTYGSAVQRALGTLTAVKLETGTFHMTEQGLDSRMGADAG